MKTSLLALVGFFILVKIVHYLLEPVLAIFLLYLGWRLLKPWYYRFLINQTNRLLERRERSRSNPNH